jgi:hypothetical protein
MQLRTGFWFSGYINRPGRTLFSTKPEHRRLAQNTRRENWGRIHHWENTFACEFGGLSWVWGFAGCPGAYSLRRWDQWPAGCRGISHRRSRAAIDPPRPWSGYIDALTAGKCALYLLAVVSAACIFVSIRWWPLGGAPRSVRPWRAVAGHFSLVSGNREDGEDARIVGSHPTDAIRPKVPLRADRSHPTISNPMASACYDRDLGSMIRWLLWDSGLRESGSNRERWNQIGRPEIADTLSVRRFCKRAPSLFRKQPAVHRG